MALNSMIALYNFLLSKLRFIQDYGETIASHKTARSLLFQWQKITHAGLGGNATREEDQNLAHLACAQSLARRVYFSRSLVFRRN